MLRSAPRDAPGLCYQPLHPRAATGKVAGLSEAAAHSSIWVLGLIDSTKSVASASVPCRAVVSFYHYLWPSRRIASLDLAKVVVEVPKRRTRGSRRPLRRVRLAKKHLTRDISREFIIDASSEMAGYKCTDVQSSAAMMFACHRSIGTARFGRPRASSAGLFGGMTLA